MIDSMSSDPIHIGIVGTGGMAHQHMRLYNEITGVKVVGCCDIDQDRAATFAKEQGIPNSYGSMDELFKSNHLQAISNVTPDAAHADVAEAAAAHGLHILSEKPLATTYDEGKAMVKAVKNAGIINMVNFSYRNSSALQDCALRIQQGDLGRIIHVETSYLQSWLSSDIWENWRRPGLLWRLSTAHGSQGVLGDIGCHLYDATVMLAGEFNAIFCTLKTYDKGEPDNRYGEYVLDANDSLTASVVFKNGALGSIHSTRWATGHTNSLRFRVYGDDGAIEIDLDQSYEEYRICVGDNKHTTTWETVKAKPSPNNHQRFVDAIRTGNPPPSDFENGLNVQAYLHYSIESDKLGKSVKII